MRRTRVLIIDDHKRVLAALLSALDAEPDLDVAGTAGSAPESIADALRFRPDVVLLEVKRDDGRGIDICRGIVQARPSTRVLILTSYPNEREQREVQATGAAAYLLKDLDQQELLRQIKDQPTKEKTMRNRLHYGLLLAVVGAVFAGAPAAEPQNKDAMGTLQGRVAFEAAAPGVTAADAVVYLQGDGLAASAVPAKDGAALPVLDQRDITYVPHVLPVMAGSKVEVRNSDNIMHNIHTRSDKNPSFNRAQMRHRSFEVVFQHPETIHVSCDIHSQMSASVVVLPTPFFAKAEKNGAYTIAGVPPGQYELVAWHEKHGTVTTRVQVAAGKVTQANVAFSRASASAKADSK